MQRELFYFNIHVWVAIILIADSLHAETESINLLKPFLATHCAGCHDSETRAGGLDLQGIESNLNEAASTSQWIRVFDRVSSGEMPPKSEDRPPVAETQSFLQTLSKTLTHADGRDRQAGIRRLNRIEYENTVRDLFGIRVDIKDLLPMDPNSQGFDTVGAALGISSEQMEAYLQAADQVLDCIYGPDREPPRIDVRIPFGQEEFANKHVGKLFLKAQDDSLTLFQDHWCPSVFLSGKAKVNGTYRVTIHAKTFQTKYPLVMAVNGGDVVVGRGLTHLVGYYDVTPGEKWTVVTFEDHLEKDGAYKITPYRLRAPTSGPDRFKGPGLTIGEVSIEGPLEPWPPASRDKLLGKIDLKTARITDAKEILSRLLPKAFRRTIQPEEVQPFLALIQSALDAHRPFREALDVALKAILCSPEFVMKEEAVLADNPTRITPETLASRISYFLWSSMPDDELLNAAVDGRLARPEVLRDQVERMLRDPKSARFTENFAGQWLGLRDINFTEPDSRLYPEFDEMLRYSIVEETQRFFREILDQNKTLLDFVDADWAILNERLAIHYGIGGVRGQEFRRVNLPQGSIRGGVMTQASVLKVTANGTSTSPVVRGNWVLSNILGQPSPPPPPNVPGIEPDIRTAKTMRDRLAKHRAIKSCAACHDRIDPPGFALESFDPIGGFRKSYRTLGQGSPVNLEIDGKRVQFKSGSNIDASGQFTDGRGFSDIRQFKKLLREQKHQITQGLTEKLLIYALGRRLCFADRPAIQEIAQNVSAKNFGFRSLIHEIIQSQIFLEK